MLAMMEHDGKVIGIDHMPELTEKCKSNLLKNHSESLENGNISILTGDGREGFEDFAPYDVIHVGAAIDEIPEKLTHQLNVNGIMVIPIGSESSIQKLTLCYKTKDHKIISEPLIDVCYVPLTSKVYQLCRL